VIKLLKGIHKFYSTGRWVLRIVVSIHLLILLSLLVSDFFLDLFNKKKIVYTVQIVSTGDLNPVSAQSTPREQSVAKPKTEPKEAVVKPKKVSPPKKKIVKPKKISPPKKKVVKPKKVAPVKRRVVKPKKTVAKPKTVVKPRKKVRTAEEIRRDFLKNSKPVKRTKKRRDLSHLLDDKQVSAQDISKRFSQALDKVKVNSSRSGTASNYNYSNYYGQLSSYLYGRWKQPQIPQDYQATIEVTVSKWGTVLKKRIVQRSGNSIMDNSVQRMLNSLTKLPKLPSSSKDSELTITITLKLEH